MNKNLKLKALFIVLVCLIFAWFSFPLNKRINLGLDLQGGMHLVLRVDTSKLSEDAKRDAVERALEIVRNRIDEFGVGETSILRQGEDEIVVQLPGVTDRQRALDLIGRTALLEFKLVNSDPEKLRQALAGQVPDGYELSYIEKEEKRPVLLEKTACLVGEKISDAQVHFDRSAFGQPYVSLKLNDEGAKIFAKVTAENVGRQLAIVLDGKVYSAPRINEPIPSGEGQITGRFSFEEASDLAIVLRVGALPAPLYIEEERTIGPLLGQDSIRSGVRASIIGCALVFIFMAVYYLLAGLIANIALALNLLIILGSLGFLKTMLPQQQVTLTLPGIAGIVLTLGMAVDANVLINERIREELSAGKALFTAVNNGYHKAFSAIFDSNVTTLIAAFLLFQFGTGPIRGFAITLTIGLLASMFTAIFVTRVILELLISAKLVKNLPMLRLIRQTKIDFIGKRKIWYTVSIVTIIVGLFAFFVKGKQAYGIDFAGGQLQEYSFQQPIAVDSLRSTLKEAGLSEISIQQFKENPKIVIVRSTEDTANIVEKNLREKFSDNKFDVLRVEKVGPAVGKELRKRAILAIIWSLLGIMVYVAFRFKHFNFAAAGVIALFHDILVAVGFIALTGRQMDLLIVTGLLTIAGYSINDTIVIYDRVRENLRLSRKMNLAEVINLSVNQTLSRTILTSGVTLLVVIALLAFGGEVLNGLAFCLLIGFISGVYSTVYIASPLVLAWQRKSK
ncbi:MAG: protein translocase subunit SecD [Candidatus Omnitrophota bacterium]|nr:protein translocase subunit SecD [Candidatus Omnitrophota bacterium]